MDTLGLYLMVTCVFSVSNAQEACVDQLGMKDGTIPDRQITASSEWRANHGPNNARLDRPAGNGRTGAWSASSNDVNQWIQVDFGTLRSVSGIVLQGRSDYEQWVTKYKVQYSNDGSTWQYIQDNNNVDRVFNGNSDREGHVTSIFVSAISASYIRIRPTEWYGHISMRFELLGCDVSEACVDQLGMKDGTIPDGQITASSEYNANHGPNNARLDRPAGNGRTGAWSASSNDVNQWIQVDFGTLRSVSGIVLQGRSDYEQWVTKYKAQYSNDGSTWQYIQDNNNVDRVFNGNSDRDGHVTSRFVSAISAGYIRIRPTEWHGHISMRFELLGCDAATTRPSVVTSIATSLESVTTEFSVTTTSTTEALSSNSLARSSGSASAAAGASVASIVLLLVIGGVVVLIVMKRRRRQQHPESSKSQSLVQLDGPYGDTVTNIITSPPTKDAHIYAGVTGANGDAVATPPSEELYQNVSDKPGEIQQDMDDTYQDITEDTTQANQGTHDDDIYQDVQDNQDITEDVNQAYQGTNDDDIYQDVQDNEYAYAHVDTERDKVPGVNGDLVEIYAKSQYGGVPRSAENDPQQEGWVDNNVYAMSDEDHN